METIVAQSLATELDRRRRGLENAQSFLDKAREDTTYRAGEIVRLAREVEAFEDALELPEDRT